MLEDILDRLLKLLNSSYREASHYEWARKKGLLTTDKLKGEQETIKRIYIGLRVTYNKVMEEKVEEVPKENRIRTLPKKDSYSWQEFGVFLCKDAEELKNYMAQHGYIKREEEDGKIKFETLQNFLNKTHFRPKTIADYLNTSTVTIDRKAKELILPKLILVNPHVGVFYSRKSVIQLEENTKGKRSLKAKLAVLGVEDQYQRLYPKIKGIKNQSITDIRESLINKKHYEMSILDW